MKNNWNGENWSVYGVLNGKRPKMLAGVWCKDDADRLAKHYRDSGWRSVVVKSTRAEHPIIRSQMIFVRNSDGRTRWERYYLERDVNEVAKNIADKAEGGPQ